MNAAVCIIRVYSCRNLKQAKFYVTYVMTIMASLRGVGSNFEVVQPDNEDV